MPRLDDRAALWLALPVVFVLIWSTGFVVARLGMPHASPMGFLAWRYLLSLLAFAVWIGVSRAVWPLGRVQWAHLALTGVLMHAGYLGGVWAAVKLGIGAGTVALIVGLQPVLTALWLSGRVGVQAVTARQWIGLVLGLGGLVLVVWQKLGAGEVTPSNLTLALFALLEAGSMTLHAELIVAMAWSVLVLTLGGSSLLYLLIQRGATTRVASLMYLVPPCTALLAWQLFDEPLTGQVLAGMAVTAVGVALVVRDPVRRAN